MVVTAGIHDGGVLYRDPNPAFTGWWMMPLDRFRRELSRLPFLRWFCATTPLGLEEDDGSITDVRELP